MRNAIVTLLLLGLLVGAVVLWGQRGETTSSPVCSAAMENCGTGPKPAPTPTIVDPTQIGDCTPR